MDFSTFPPLATAGKVEAVAKGYRTKHPVALFAFQAFLVLLDRFNPQTSYDMEKLKILLERKYDCKATLSEQRIAKTKKYLGGTVITCEVFTFKLEGHPMARKAFVWQTISSLGEKKPMYSVMLAVPPVNSPEAALEADITTDAELL